MRVIVDFLRLFAAFCAVGAGPYFLLAPKRWRRPTLAIPLIANLGVGLVSLVSVHLFAFDRKVLFAFPIAFALSALMTVLFVILALLQKVSVKRGPSESSPVFGRPMLLLLVTLLAFLPIGTHSPGQPFRIGIDEVGYAITAQYIKDGGHWNELLNKVKVETGYAERKQALAANCTALNFNDNISSEFVLKSLRFGYPSALAVGALICGESFVADMQMLMLIFPLWLFISIVADFLEVELGVSSSIASTFGGVVALNVNLLNIIYEGQHAQMYSMAMVAIILVTWWDFRQAETLTQTGVRYWLFTSFVFAVVLATYSEQILILLILGIAITAFDLLGRDYKRVRASSYLFLAGMVGFLLTFRYGLMWFPFIVAQTGNVASGLSGFWQPQWAQATDILGITNIYASAKPFFVGRGILTTMALGVLTLAFLDLVLVKVIVNKRFYDKAFWIAPIAVVILVFIKSFHIDHVHNYNYMKSYTLLGFPIIVLGFILLLDMARLRVVGREVSAPNACGVSILILSLAAITCNGLFYLNDYRREAAYVPDDVEALADRKLAEQLKNAEILSYRSGGIEFAMIAAYCQLNWANLGWTDPFLLPYEGKPIFLFCLRKDVPNIPQFVEHFSDHIIFSGTELLIVDTGFHVSVPKSQIGLESMPRLPKVNASGRPYPLMLTDYWIEMQKNAIQVQ